MSGSELGRKLGMGSVGKKMLPSEMPRKIGKPAPQNSPKQATLSKVVHKNAGKK